MSNVAKAHAAYRVLSLLSPNAEWYPTVKKHVESYNVKREEVERYRGGDVTAELQGVRETLDCLSTVCSAPGRAKSVVAEIVSRAPTNQRADLYRKWGIRPPVKMDSKDRASAIRQAKHNRREKRSVQLLPSVGPITGSEIKKEVVQPKASKPEGVSDSG